MHFYSLDCPVSPPFLFLLGVLRHCLAIKPQALENVCIGIRASSGLDLIV